jgi:hypothetical protein
MFVSCPITTQGSSFNRQTGLGQSAVGRRSRAMTTPVLRESDDKWRMRQVSARGTRWQTRHDCGRKPAIGPKKKKQEKAVDDTDDTNLGDGLAAILGGVTTVLDGAVEGVGEVVGGVGDVVSGLTGDLLGGDLLGGDLLGGDLLGGLLGDDGLLG